RRYVFFFQAEDGIRDFHVTGVQTCALPIYLIAIDFETATNAADSPCEMGLAIVRDGEVAEVRNWLIKPRQWPHFSPYTIAVHGRSEERRVGKEGRSRLWATQQQHRGSTDTR